VEVRRCRPMPTRTCEVNSDVPHVVSSVKPRSQNLRKPNATYQTTFISRSQVPQGGIDDQVLAK